MKDETEKQNYALAIYQNLGINRGLRKLEILTGITKSKLGRWAKECDWELKIKEFDAKQISGADQQKALDALIPRFKTQLPAVDRQEQKLLGGLLEQCGIVLKTGFEKNEKTGNLEPKFEIRNVKEYVAILGAIRDLIDLLRKERGGKSEGGTGKKATTNIENLLVMLGDADESTQREFITASHGATVGKRASGASGAAQEADFEEVPDADATED